MDIVIDTSAVLAVILDEPERERIVALTTGNTLIGPGSIPWEIGNAFSAMVKRRRLGAHEAVEGMQIFKSIPMRTVAVDMSRALSIAVMAGLYAYDAYFLDCAQRHGAPILTLDGTLGRAARALKLNVIEV